MPFLSWLFPSHKPAKPAPPPVSSGLSRMDATRPTGRHDSGEAAPSTGNAQPANRKNERMARRELLYNVVRAAMMRAGILSASYKFKVLSLDGRGRQFLVMIDLSRDHAGEIGKLAEIEALIAQGAKTRHDIVVTAVYWRTNEHVAVGEPQHAIAIPDSQPAPLEPSPPVQLQPGPARFDPIQADEVAAFRQALAAGTAAPLATVPGTAVAAVAAAPGQGATARAFDGSSRHGPQSYTLLTGFEDTELPDGDLKAQALSGTQYGELR